MDARNTNTETPTTPPFRDDDDRREKAETLYYQAGSHIHARNSDYISAKKEENDNAISAYNECIQLLGDIAPENKTDGDQSMVIYAHRDLANALAWKKSPEAKSTFDKALTLATLADDQAAFADVLSSLLAQKQLMPNKELFEKYQQYTQTLEHLITNEKNPSDYNLLRLARGFFDHGNELDKADKKYPAVCQYAAATEAIERIQNVTQDVKDLYMELFYILKLTYQQRPTEARANWPQSGWFHTQGKNKLAESISKEAYYDLALRVQLSARVITAEAQLEQLNKDHHKAQNELKELRPAVEKLRNEAQDNSLELSMTETNLRTTKEKLKKQTRELTALRQQLGVHDEKLDLVLKVDMLEKQLAEASTRLEQKDQEIAALKAAAGKQDAPENTLPQKGDTSGASKDHRKRTKKHSQHRSSTSRHHATLYGVAKAKTHAKRLAKKARSLNDIERRSHMHI